MIRHDSFVRARCVCSAGVVAALAGAAANAQTFTGAVNGNWNNAANWSTNPATPVNNGAANIVFNAVPAANRNTNQNLANPFNLTTLQFSATATNIRIGGDPLRFNNVAAIINDTNDDLHFIDSAIILNADLTIRGTANRVNAETELFINGQITQAGGVRHVTVAMARNCDVLFAGNNAAGNWTGNLTLQGGNLVLDSGAAVGNGTLLINGNVSAVSVRARVGNTVTVTRPLDIQRDVSFGDVNANTSGTLKFNGPINIGGGFPRTLFLVGGGVPLLQFGGAITCGGELRIRGDTAPTFAGKKLATEGSLMSIIGDSPAFRGGLTVEKSTMRLQGTLGAAATPIMGNVVIGDGATGAAFVGKGKVWLDKTTFIQPGGRQGARFKVRDMALSMAGGSPGQFIVNGGGVTFEGGSIMQCAIGGPPSVSDPVGSSQWVIEDGDLDLLYNGSQHPCLSVIVESQNYIPQLGDSWCIVDIQSSLVPRVDLPNPLNPYNSGPNLFEAPDGSVLFNLSTFVADGFTFQIRYNGEAADPGNAALQGNDIILTVVAIPAPGAAGLLAIGGLIAVRRRRS